MTSDRSAADPRTVTTAYELWLGEQIPLVRADLERKHQEMNSSVMRFLRGTYYLWLQRVGELAPQLLDRPDVPLVGDIHVENFGTWTDHKGVLRWGVNDFDELGWGPYTLDLVRLATSAALTAHLAMSASAVCRTVLDVWGSTKPRRSVSLSAPDSGHLRALVPAPPTDKAFYRALVAGHPLPDSVVPADVRRAAQRSVPGQWRETWFAREAGTGSLGHARAVAVGKGAAGSGVQAREVKQLGPPTAGFVQDRLGGDLPRLLPVGDDVLYGRVLTALRGPAIMARVHGWQLRALSPRVQRIEIGGLRRRDAERVLRSMTRALADVHGASPGHLDRARADASSADKRWLHDAVEAMVDDTQACYRAWVTTGKGRG